MPYLFYNKIMAVFKVFRTDDEELQVYLNSEGKCYISISDIVEVFTLRSIALDKDDLLNLIDELRDIADNMEFENPIEEEGGIIRRANL